MSELEAVVASGLDLRFGDKVAVAESDFVLPDRGVSVLIGPNGSGKSTILSAIAGLHRPFRGTVEVLGTSPQAARSRVALVPQSTKVNDTLPVTVAEVVAMGRYSTLRLTRRFGDEDRRAVDAVLERLRLGDLRHRHLRELSGGQRQRVFVAQGLVQRHDLLLLDEPTMALDMLSTQVIHEAIGEERTAGRPVAVTSHDLNEARRADHVLLLANRVVASGPPEAVLTPQHLAEAYRFEIGELAAGHLHLDDAAHQPTASRHVHVEPPRPGLGHRHE